MNKESHLQNTLILFSDIAAIYLSIVLAFYTRPIMGVLFPIVQLSHGISVYLFKWWSVLIVIIIVAYYRGYSIVINVWDELLVLSRSLFLAFLIVWVIISLQKEGETVSRIIISLSFIYMLLFMFLFRLGLKFLLYRLADLRKPAYMVNAGNNEETDEIRLLLNNEWYSGFKVVGYLNRNTVLNEKLINICFFPMEYTDEETIKTLKPHVKNLIIISKLPGFSFMNTEIKTFLNKNVALFTAANGLLTTQKIHIKRIFDILLSVTGIIFFSPLYLLIPLCIKLDSKGPAVFKHKRCGKKLAEFDMFKFRTMHVDGHLLLDRYLNKNPEALVDLEERNKIENDPRVTRVGLILRKTSLDELPQLFNVLTGDMSLVGPRPDSKDVIEKYYKDYEVIYDNVRPGITGLWQVSGRSEVKYNERVKLDYFYTLNWSMWLDFVIIIKTFRALISARGAY
jgi:undecaprenyl-phosphate galactose phosphotransferase